MEVANMFEGQDRIAPAPTPQPQTRQPKLETSIGVTHDLRPFGSYHRQCSECHAHAKDREHDGSEYGRPYMLVSHPKHHHVPEGSTLIG